MFGSHGLPAPSRAQSWQPFSSFWAGEGTQMRERRAWFGQKGPHFPGPRGKYALCWSSNRDLGKGGEVVTVLLLRNRAMLLYGDSALPYGRGCKDSSAPGDVAEELGRTAGYSRGCRDRQVLLKGPG